MSYLIDSYQGFYKQIQEQHLLQNQKSEINKHRQNNSIENSRLKINQLMSKSGGINFIIKQTNHSLSYYMLQENKVSLSSFIVQVIKYNKQRNNWANNVQFIDTNNLYLKFSSRDQIILLMKQLVKLSSSIHLIKIGVCPENGVLKVSLPNQVLTLFSGLDFMKMIALLIKQAEALIETYRELFLMIQQMKYSNSTFPKLLNKAEKTHVSNLHSYLKKYGVQMTLSNSANELSNSNLALIQQRQKQSKQKLTMRYIPIIRNDIKQLRLFIANDQVINQCLSKDDLEFSFFQIQSLKNKVKMPSLSKCQNIHENNSILNYIKIRNKQKINLHLINQGGFTNIYMTEIEYWYVYSGDNASPIISSKQGHFGKDNMLQKIMAAKRYKHQNQNHNVVRDRICHEKQILKKIKNGNAIFVPKYYISVDQNFLKNDLLSDFIFQPNLIQYVLANRLSLSVSSKIYMLFMLVQAMRYLKLYNIVHLDLKPNNIMISKSMMIKLIDFGESYHPQICSREHAPGFSMPYSAPETYYPSGKFSDKNDIFSLGVVAYEIFYKKFPFYLFNEATRSTVYRSLQYHKYWYYNPEELTNYGDQVVFPIIQYVIGRCMDPEPENRPELDWICLILRECIDYYY